MHFPDFVMIEIFWISDKRLRGVLIERTEIVGLVKGLIRSKSKTDISIRPLVSESLVGENGFWSHLLYGPNILKVLML